MKKLLLAFILPAALLFSPVAFQSCSSISVPTGVTANQNVVVDAEKTIAISTETFDTFLKAEHDNRAFVKTHLPQVHSFAEYLRPRYNNWLLDADHAKNAYKKGTISLGDLQSVLKILTDNSKTASTYVTQIGGH